MSFRFTDFGYGVIEEENNTTFSEDTSEFASDIETEQELIVNDVEPERTDTKMCITCGETFPATLEFFRKESKKRKHKKHDGLTGVCKKCAKVRDKGYRQKYKGDINSKLETVYKDHTSNDDEVALAKKLMTNARSRANFKNLEFTLKLDDILPLPAFCQYTKVPLKYNRENEDNSASIDRIDNSKGYIPGNVKIVTQQINKIKGDLSLEQLQERIELYQTILRQI